VQQACETRAELKAARRNLVARHKRVEKEILGLRDGAGVDPRRGTPEQREEYQQYLVAKREDLLEQTRAVRARLKEIQP
jgi:hypothetical protein